MRHKKNYRPRRNQERLFKNEEIRAPKLLVINEKGEKLGELQKEEAITQAKEADLDLVLVAPQADPPVARITSWSKLQYERSKKQKQGGAKAAEMKGMRLTPFIGPGDFAHKLKRSREFLGKKHPVKFTVMAKGRVERDALIKMMNKVKSELENEVDFEGNPKFEGRNLSLIVYPKKK